MFEAVHCQGVAAGKDARLATELAREVDVPAGIAAAVAAETGHLGRSATDPSPPLGILSHSQLWYIPEHS